MPVNWTIYYDYDKSTTTVLLTDGAWTEQNNCNRREQFAPDSDPVVLVRPKLFTTRGGAKNYKATHLPDRKCFRVARYTGPMDPEARPIRKTYDLIATD